MSTADAGSAVRVVDSILDGRTGHRIPIRDYLPASRGGGAPLLWVHGGGFMTGSIDMRESDAVARAVAATGRHIRTVDYRLVPMVRFRGAFRLKPSDNRYPAALHDVLDSYLDLVESSHSAAVLGGASAGACLALSAALHEREIGAPLPSALVLAYGTFHGRPATMSRELASRLRVRDHALGLLIGRDSLERMNINYGGSAASLDDHRVFPGGGNLRGLPPTLILDADRDALRASGEALARELADAGGDVTAEVLRGTAHGFLDKPATAGFDMGLATLIAWLDARS